jgi:F-type H+-transporting ATPase subunit b
MELNWTTFALEMINFIVLIWILQRFLYSPVKRVITERQQNITNTLAQADQVRQQAQRMEEKFASRLDEWEHEKQQRRSQFLAELEQEKRRQMTTLKKDLEAEREKFKAREEQKLQALLQQNHQRAISQAAQFCARLLGRLATPHLETQIIEMFLDDLKQYDQTKFSSVNHMNGVQPAVTISSAYQLSDLQQKQITQALQTKLDINQNISLAVDPSLISGIKVDLGQVSLNANIKDELEYFAEVGRHD